VAVLTRHSDPTDDSEPETDFKSEKNNTHISDNDESPSKKAKTKVKVETEDRQFHDSGFETGFGADGAEDMEEGMYA
jgi:hypothetical protein